MPNLTASDVRVFVPARDFALSAAFYAALGWTVNWNDDHLAELELSGHRFFLQNYYAKDWAENFMLHIQVEDAQAWHDHAAAIVATNRFPGIRVAAPKQEPYGALVTYVWDPCGVLLHFAQPNPA